MDDCCALEEAVGIVHTTATLGVLDLVSDHELVVTAIYTSGRGGNAGADVHPHGHAASSLGAHPAQVSS